MRTIKLTDIINRLASKYYLEGFNSEEGALHQAHMCADTILEHGCSDCCGFENCMICGEDWILNPYKVIKNEKGGYSIIIKEVIT